MTRWRDVPIIMLLVALVVAVAMLTPGCITRTRYVYTDTPTNPDDICISNQKQIAQAAKMYSDDWDSTSADVGHYSDDFSGVWTPAADRHWMDVIADKVNIYRQAWTSKQCQRTSTHQEQAG